MKSLHNYLLIAFFSLLSLYGVSACAQECRGTPVGSCNAVNANSSTCGNYYVSNNVGGGTQCKWTGSDCSNVGGSCGNQPAAVPAAPPAPPAPTTLPSSGAAPIIAGTLTWKMTPPLAASTTGTSYCDSSCGYYYIYYMTGTVTSNGNNSYLISGFAEAAYTQSLPTPVATQYSEIPGLGSMRLVGDSYQMMANAVFQPPVEKPNPVFLSLGCTFSATTLSGGCFTIPTDGSPSQTVQASLVAN